MQHEGKLHRFRRVRAVESPVILTPEAPVDAALKLRVALALTAVYIIWGSTYLAIRYSLIDFPPFIMAGSRFVIAGVVLGAVALLRGNALPTPRQ